MEINEILMNTLTHIFSKVAPHEYVGKEKTYCVFNYFTLGDDYGDDNPGHERYLVQIHLFFPLPTNSLSTIKQTKRALADAGFTWPSTTDASDEDGQHIVLECEYAKEVDLDGDDGN